MGFFLGGPLGMIAGAVFGHMIDKGSDIESSQDSTYGPRFFYSTGYDRSQMVFFVGAFSMLAKLASADGVVREDARRKIDEFMRYDLHLNGNSYQYAWSVFDNALKQDVSFESLADQFYQNFHNTPQLLQLMVDIFYKVAMVDGSLSANEERLIDYAAKTFRIAQSILDSIKRRYGVSDSLAKAYATLGLSESATEAEIKKAYRKLIMEFHPDTVASKGMAEEFKEYATKRFREIQEAYEQISKERGIK